MALNRATDQRLGRLIKVVETIGDQTMQARLSTLLARKMLQLIDQSIATSTDCYGRPMPMRVDDGAAPLQGLRGTFTASFTGNGPRVGCSKWYAAVHNRGATIEAKTAPYLRFRLPSGRWVSERTVIIPRRQLAPSQSTGGLGPVWGPALGDVTAEFMREYVQGR